MKTSSSKVAFAATIALAVIIGAGCESILDSARDIPDWTPDAPPETLPTPLPPANQPPVAGTVADAVLTGAPAVSMFYYACANMSGVTNAYVFTFSSNITFTAANANTVTRGWHNMSNWKGQVLWGTNVLALAIPIPDVDNNAFVGCVNMPNYGVIHANWK